MCVYILNYGQKIIRSQKISDELLLRNMFVTVYSFIFTY